LSAEHNSPNLA